MASFEKKGIRVHYGKDRFGDYYIHSAFSKKRPPEDKKKARAFYKKGGLGKRIDRIQRDNKKYRTLKSLKMNV